MTPSHPRERGFSLIELMVASAIAILVIATASMALLSQYQGMQTADFSRLANGSSRSAISNIETSLRRAGWGIDPRYALDFKYNCAGTPCRDKTNGPDELAFVSRNPMYRWLDNGEGACATAGGCFTGNAWPPVLPPPTAGSVTVAFPAGYTLHKGQVILVTCASGLNPVMFTLSAGVTGGQTTLSAAPDVAGDPYNNPSGIVPGDCHEQAGAAVFLVDRFRYFIQTINGTPWLMLDTGLDLNDDGTLPPGDTADLIPVAKNVEDMQVAYVMNSSATMPVVSTDWIVGDDPGTQEEPAFSATQPLYSTPLDDPSRFLNLAGNVRAVRVSLIIRSDRTDKSHGTSWTGEQIPNAENRTAASPAGQWRRYTAETEITLHNLESRLPFIF